jgi:hypothetical protein
MDIIQIRFTPVQVKINIMMIHYYIADCGAFKVHANYPFPLCASRLKSADLLFVNIDDMLLFISVVLTPMFVT